VKYNIEIPSIDALHIIRGKSKGRVSKITNEQYYHIDVFYTILNMQMQELNSRFSETTTDFLLGVACLNPSDSFSNFDKKKILRMAQLYPDDFDDLAIKALACKLDTFIANVVDGVRLSNISGLTELSKKLVQTKNHLSFAHLHQLLKLAFIVPISTTTIERVFFTMKFIKTKLRNKISYEFLNNTVVAYFDIDLFKTL